MTIQERINQVVNPHGGDPKVEGPALNALLKILATETAANFTADAPGVLGIDLAGNRQQVDLNLPITIPDAATTFLPDPAFLLPIVPYQQPGQTDMNAWSGDASVVTSAGGGVESGSFQYLYYDISSLPKGDYVLHLDITAVVDDTLYVYVGWNQTLLNTNLANPGHYEFPITQAADGWCEVYFSTNNGTMTNLVLARVEIYSAPQQEYFLGLAIEGANYDPATKRITTTARAGDKTIDLSSLVSSTELANYNYATVAYVNGLSSSAQIVSYADLSNMAYYGQLVPGKWYYLSDYQLTHVIPNTNETWTSYTEPLLVQAATTNSIGGPGYSVYYPQDIIWYTIGVQYGQADPRVPGATKGFIYRRHDTQQNNDIDIDFRNVRFRRWYMDRGSEVNEYYGFSTSAYLLGTDNGSGNYQDRQMFENYSAVRNCQLRNFPRTYNNSIFQQLNLVVGYGMSRFSDITINDSTFINATLEIGWMIRSDFRGCTVNGFLMPGTRFFDFFGGTILQSTITNFENRQNNIEFTMLYTNANGWGQGAVPSIGYYQQPGQNVIIQGEYWGSVMVQTINSTTVYFRNNAEYQPILSGTFTVNTTGKVVGRVVTVYLGPSATAPTLDPAQFQVKGAFTAGKNNEFMFKVGANGFIQCTITQLD
jgi:hypothetical protein